MKNNLKMFVWGGVLSDYTSSLAVAVARSQEDAIKVLSRKIRNGSYRDSKGRRRNAYIALRESEIEELRSSEPRVYPLDKGYWRLGSGRRINGA